MADLKQHLKVFSEGVISTYSGLCGNLLFSGRKTTAPDTKEAVLVYLFQFVPLRVISLVKAKGWLFCLALPCEVFMRPKILQFLSVFKIWISKAAVCYGCSLSLREVVGFVILSVSLLLYGFIVWQYRMAVRHDWSY